MKIYTIITIIITLSLLFTACSTNENNKFVCSDGNVVNDPSHCNAKIEDKPVSVDTDENIETIEATLDPVFNNDIEDYFTSDTLKFIGVSDEKEGITKDVATGLYVADVEAEITFTNSNLLDNGKLFMKVFQKKTSNFTEIKLGEQIVPFKVELSTITESPRVKFCFSRDKNFKINDDSICIKKVFNSAKIESDIYPQSSTIRLRSDKYEDGDIITATEKFHIQNTGNIGLIYYFYIDKAEQMDVSVETDNLYLAPGAEGDFILNIKHLYDGRTVRQETLEANIYAIAGDCSISKECSDGAKVKNKMDIKIID